MSSAIRFIGYMLALIWYTALAVIIISIIRQCYNILLYLYLQAVRMCAYCIVTPMQSFL